MVVSPDGSRVYVSGWAPDDNTAAVSVIDTATCDFADEIGDVTNDVIGLIPFGK